MKTLQESNHTIAYENLAKRAIFSLVFFNPIYPWIGLLANQMIASHWPLASRS